MITAKGDLEKNYSDKHRALFIGAHPDDIELGAGGTLLKHLGRGDDVYVLVVTRGEKGNHSQTMSECHASFQSLGVKPSNIKIAEFPDAHLKDDHTLIDFIETYAKEVDPTRVYAHHFEDRHQDHRYLSKAVSAAARNFPQLLLYEGPSTAQTFNPHYYIPISKQQLDGKISSLGCYTSQIEKGIVDLERVKLTARIRGMDNNVRYAEAFGLNHFVLGENDV
jgi:LmbE family N-acetylglucosaminyl deacetylase